MALVIRVRLREDRADVRLAAGFGEAHLAFALGIAGALGRVAGVVAGGAADALNVERRGAVGGADGHAAGMAQAVRAGGEAVPTATR